jgi:hypothetical protein
MSIAGAWTEVHADLMLGLLAIRASGGGAEGQQDRSGTPRR